ncbi:MAG: Na/Pi symporter [Candidatus Hydrogenedentes bacterium]|nr:Na/Pi symporter [Candidatus Hydrogenedentota bacterium]
MNRVRHMLEPRPSTAAPDRRSFRAAAGPLFALSVLLVCLSGCGLDEAVQPDRIRLDEYASGDKQCAPHGAVLPAPLRVVVESRLRPGLLGGKGSRHPLPGVDVTFTILNPETGAVFADTGTTVTHATTDAAGTASAGLRMGRLSRDVNVAASIVTPDGEKSVELSALPGVELIGEDLEAPVNGTIEEIGVRLTDPDGQPAAGVPVYFRVEGNRNASTLNGRPKQRLLTGPDGRAVVSWKLGEEVGLNFVRVELQDDRPGIPDESRFQARAIDFHAMAISKRRMLIDLLGGLAIFILGMKWMSAGLRRMADRRLKNILQAVTRNRIMAMGVGLGLTAIIQSSSATTVMAVGFVNAGLLTLAQSIGVIYGASIGTTVTAQIIAFQLNILAFPAIGLGLIMSAASRRLWVKSLGDAILGFGLLFLGLTLMADVLEPLRHSPTFLGWFQLFDCTPADGGAIKAGPALMCILIGTVVTVVIQSSSATVGLVLVLSGQGLLSFYTAVPLVLGDNIGTTITAILASLGANRNAKRAALAHTLFKVFGAAYMYVLLFVPLWDGHPVFLGLIDYITPGNVFADCAENLPRHIANAHTVFNVVNVLIFLPFVGAMVRLCQAIIPVTGVDQERVLEYLEPHLLNSPSLALQQAVREVAYMVRRAQKSINEACAFFQDGSRELEERVTRREELIDQLQHEITAYLVELSRKNMSPQEATLLPALIHAVNDAERIGDHSENLIELAHLRSEHNHILSGAALDDVRNLLDILNEQFEATYQSLTEQDAGQVEGVLEKEQAITDFMAEAAERHVVRLEKGECEVQAGVVFLDLLAHLERVGDHLVNIAERAGRIIQVTAG